MAGCERTACCSWYLAFFSGATSFQAAPSSFAISAKGVSGLADFSSARLSSQNSCMQGRGPCQHLTEAVIKFTSWVQQLYICIHACLLAFTSLIDCLKISAKGTAADHQRTM